MIWAAVLKNWRPILLGLAVLALLAATAFTIRSGIATVNAMVEARGEAVRQERNAFWEGEIAKGNAKAAAALAEQALKTAGLEAALSAAAIDTRAQLTELETKDAGLPAGDAVGLDAARVGLLPRKAKN